MIVLLCPGQGSQTPGFLEPWLADPELAATLNELSESSGVDLVKHGTTSDADTIRETDIAQPLIVAASLLSFQALSKAAKEHNIEFSGGDFGVVGHSVGEFAAAAIAQVVSTSEAVALVKERSLAMAEAAAKEKTSMAAVIGSDPDTVIAAIEAAGAYPANFNGKGQIVAAGSLESLEKLAANAPKGTRVIPLQVAGAFHTPYMESAKPRLAAVAKDVQPHNPVMNLWTNHDGAEVVEGQDFLDLLVGQVASPVRWDLNMESLSAAGVKGVIELTPAGTLVGLCRRGLPGIPSVAIKSPEDINSALELILA